MASDQGTEMSDRDRFQLELEFVQCLSNPQYLNWLAQNDYFSQESFVNYLKYLQYWKQQEYSTYLIYPQCLFFLDLLQTKEFRTAIAKPQYKELVHSQQFNHWQHYRVNRVQDQVKQAGMQLADTDANQSAAQHQTSAALDSQSGDQKNKQPLNPQQ